MNTNAVTWVTVRDLVLLCDLVLTFLTWYLNVSIVNYIGKFL